MDLGKFGGLIETLAPTIATALGGPVAGLAVKALSTALFGHGNADEADITAALGSATPEQISAIRKIDNDFKVQMKSLDIDLVKIAASDRASARDMASSTHSYTPSVLSYITVFCWAIIQYYLFTHVIDPSMRELIARVLGTLDGALMLVLSFWFGSSNPATQSTK
jgi:hypothetical protein